MAIRLQTVVSHAFTGTLELVELEELDAMLCLRPPEAKVTSLGPIFS